MKLKKIASLMLAGIMAVSMLAACGEGKKDDSSSSSSTPVATGIVADMKDSIKTFNDKLTVDVKESAFVNGELKELFEKNTLAQLKATNWKLVTDLLVADYNADIASRNLMTTDLTNSNYNVSASNDREAWFYAVVAVDKADGIKDQKAAVDAIAVRFKDVTNEFRGTDNSGNDYTYTADYTMYVSLQNATVVGDTTTPVVIVALKRVVSQKI